MTNLPKPLGAPSRRDLLCVLVGSVLFGATCGSSPTRRDHADDLFSDLRDQLIAVATDDEDLNRLLAAYDAVEEDCLAFLAQHEAFAQAFETMTADRETPDAQLNGLVADAVEDRLAIRNRLLLHQQSLRVSLGEERWGTVATRLNDRESMYRMIQRGS